MVALLVALSIMAVLMTVAMPTWRQAAQREKEAELIFRGQQYARAIGLFQKKAGPGVLPPSIDALVDGHYLRKKYTDPITSGASVKITIIQTRSVRLRMRACALSRRASRRAPRL